MKEIIPDATRHGFKENIFLPNKLWRELKKKKMVIQNAKSVVGEELYTRPSFWFYEALDFLRDQEIQEDGISTMDINEEVRKYTVTLNKCVHVCVCHYLMQ